MQVSALWRHPVKSLQGERLDQAAVAESGFVGDREWGLRDAATGRILTARRDAPLLMAEAVLDGDGAPLIKLPSGKTIEGVGADVDAALSDWLGKDVTLARAVDEPASQSEYYSDAIDESSLVIKFKMPEGRFVDVMPVLVITTASLRAGRALHPDGDWDARRFRPNVVVEADHEGWVEDGWAGRTIRLGEVELRGAAPCIRCTIVTRPQPGLDRDLDIHRAIARDHGGNFGLWCSVTLPGTVHVGDLVELG